VNSLKVKVDPDLCIACGACIDIAPEIFDWNDEGLSYATVDEVPEDKEESAKEAVESCPTEAIKEL
jgi:ferredoxin